MARTRWIIAMSPPDEKPEMVCSGRSGCGRLAIDCSTPTVCPSASPAACATTSASAACAALSASAASAASAASPASTISSLSTAAASTSLS